MADTDAAARQSRWFEVAWWQVAAAAAILGMIVLVVWPASPRVSGPAKTSPPTVASADPMQVDELRGFDDDPALALLADLSVGLDWDAASEAGLVPTEGTADRVVFTLSAEERVELHRLLKEALAAAGA